MTRRLRWAALALLSLAVAATAFHFWPDGGDASLRPFVLGRPAYPVVFTSRSEPASFRAAATGSSWYAPRAVPKLSITTRLAS